MSIIKDQLRRDKKQDMLLIYGSKTKEDVIFKDEIDNIKDNRFKIVYVLSNEESIPEYCERGFIDKKIIEKHVKDANLAVFYLCGPGKMKECVRKALLEMGVKSRDIRTEDFFW